MFRWLRERRKAKTTDKHGGHVEDDYGFGRKRVLTESKDTDCVVHDKLSNKKGEIVLRARMPTPVVNLSETSCHIYDEIPDIPNQTRFPVPTETDLDIVRDTRRDPIDLSQAIEVGPYLIVPICDPSCSKPDVEIFKRETKNCPNDSDESNGTKEYNPPWDVKETSTEIASNADILKDAKIVLTRCVKTRLPQNNGESNKVKENLCSSLNREDHVCSERRWELDSESLADSNSRTLTGSPDIDESSASRTLTATPDSDAEPEPEASCNSEGIADCEFDGNDTCCEYDMSTSGESDLSERSSEYVLHLSKIENNLKLKHNVRRIIRSLGKTIHEDDISHDSFPDVSDIDSMTYVSSLSEYSSARSHISDAGSDSSGAADQSVSDDSSGYYECQDEKQTSPSHSCSHDTSRVHLERSVSAPEVKSRNSQSTNHEHRKCKDRLHHKLKKSKYRSQSFDCSVYSSRSGEDQEMYLLPMNKRSDSTTSGSRQTRNKTVLAPQPTPSYMDPYRGKTGNHNRLLGDLIRMNYDKQLLIKM